MHHLMQQKIIEIILRELNIEGIGAENLDGDLNLVDELGIDSMDLATVAVFIQDEFGIKFQDEDYPLLTSVNAICECVLKKRGNNF